MAQKKIFITLGVLVVITAVGFFGWILSRPASLTPQVVYTSQLECERASGKTCTFQICDYIPAGKTFEEICGKGFKQGWVASSTNTNTKPSTNSQLLNTSSNQPAALIGATLEIVAPFSTAKLTIFHDGSATYSANRKNQPETLTSYVAGTFTPTQMAELYDLIERNNFFTLTDRPQSDSDLTDGSTYLLTISIRPAGSPGLVDATVHQVSCYQFNCEPTFISIKDFITQSYGKELLEVGV